MATTNRTLIVKTADEFGNENQKTFSHANPAATAQNIDTFTRAVAGLSKDTYVDTIIRDEISVNETLAE